MKFSFKLTHKIMALILVVVALSIGGLGLISSSMSSAYLTDAAKGDLAHLTAMSMSLCELAAEESLAKVKSDLHLARATLDLKSGGQVTVNNDQMVIGGDADTRTLNGNNDLVDAVQNMTGSACSVFLRKGSQATRIATTMVDEAGRRSTGTLLDPDVFRTVVNERETYVGRAWVIDQYYVTAYEPIYDAEQQVIGIIAVARPEATPTLRQSILNMKVGQTGYIYCMDLQGVLRVHPKSEGKDISSNAFAREMTTHAPDLAAGEIAWINYEWDRNGTMEEKIVAYAYFPEWDWIVAVGSYLDEFTAPVSQLQRAVMLAGLVLLLISLAVGFFLARTITRPIGRLTNIAEAVRVGDISTKADIKSQDEVGTLATGFNNMIDYIQEVATAAQSIAANDLRVAVEPKSAKDVLGHSFQRMIANLSTMVRQMGDNASQLVSAATEVASSSEQMSRGAKDQTDQVNQVSTAVEEMTATIVESSRNASEASQGSQAAADTAGTGGQIVNETIQGMQKIAAVVRESAESIGKLAKSADQIGEIISVIDDIADQTNLLALNAAIEAARAGEQGRGFAVVADEVRKLAERTGKATGEITGMIKGIQSETEDAVHSMEAGIQEVDAGRELADKAGGSLTEIVNLSQTVQDMIRQIATAAEEQSAAAEQISKNIENVASIARESATGAEQSAAAAEELNRQAEGMQQMVATFKISS